MNKENNFEYDTINEGTDAPLMITWDLLRRCSFDCTYCPPHRHDLVSPFPPYEKIWSVADFIVDYVRLLFSHRTEKVARISFTGGEPTIHPDFRKLILNLNKKFKETELELFNTVTTNGAFGDDMMNFISENMTWATVSYHTEATKIAKKRSVKSILGIHENKQNGKECGIGVNVMFHQKHFDECKELCDLLDSKNIKFNPRFIGDSGSPDLPYTHHYTEDQVDYILNFWKNKREQEDITGEQEYIATKVTTKSDKKIYARGLGRVCCAMRDLTLSNSDTNAKCPTNWISQTRFKDWYCSVNWFFLHIDQHENELLHHQTCKQLWGKKRGAITDLSKESLNTHLEWVKEKLEANEFPVLQCSKTTCSCGMCAPKSSNFNSFKKVLSDHVDVKVLKEMP